ncbi:uncharacterized protein LAESUDRAFT_759719 [Laetiporus sulphureus 93-53]|uniref:Uncharacterized protein n=1 Tax=Laetiporus sulphureus 93-53 TaxID=1314785 RepID=A0A165E3K6_9APHY|nr:uncharacterized protein LAESUDRAFT_759719 [Laetiporus sulphureus 93-53]KZT06185.1 hypothetical protein LAESUDRAFT_759719 [Laetiporus sulphureus 93-53]
MVASAHFLHIFSVITIQPGHDPSLQQGIVSKQENYDPGDLHDQAVHVGQSKSSKTPLDVASQELGSKASCEGLSASAFDSSGAHVEKGKGAQEESTPLGFLDSVKSKHGFQMTSGEVKQKTGRGEKSQEMKD